MLESKELEIIIYNIYIYKYINIIYIIEGACLPFKDAWIAVKFLLRCE